MKIACLFADVIEITCSESAESDRYKIFDIVEVTKTEGETHWFFKNNKFECVQKVRKAIFDKRMREGKQEIEQLPEGYCEIEGVVYSKPSVFVRTRNNGFIDSFNTYEEAKVVFDKYITEWDNYKKSNEIFRMD